MAVEDQPQYSEREVLDADRNAFVHGTLVVVGKEEPDCVMDAQVENGMSVLVGVVPLVEEESVEGVERYNIRDQPQLGCDFV